MVQQLGTNNQNQRLLAGKSADSAGNNGNNKDAFVANLAEKRYLWTARAFAIITAVSLGCNIILLLAIGQIIPLYRVEPFLLTFQNKEEQVYNIQRVDRRMEDEREITEVFVRQYVLLRSSFSRDIAEVEARWMPGGIIQEMSSPSVYDDFLKNTANRALELIRTRQMVRDVRIMTVNELGSGIWQIEFETRDMYPDSATPEINYFTASLKVEYRNKRVTFRERLKNPIGFTVVSFSLAHNKVK